MIKQHHPLILDNNEQMKQKVISQATNNVVNYEDDGWVQKKKRRPMNQILHHNIGPSWLTLFLIL